MRGWIAINLLWLVPLTLTTWLAARRQRSAPFWGMIAFFSGWLGFIALAVTTGLFGRGKPVQPRGVGPPDLRDPGMHLATSEQSWTPGHPTGRTLALWLTGLAATSAVVFATAAPSQQVEGLDVALLGEAEATRNAIRTVTTLTRDHDDLTLEAFTRERIRGKCGDAAADAVDFRGFISRRLDNDVFWAVFVTIPESSQHVSCSRDDLARLSGYPLAGIHSRDGKIVPIFQNGQRAAEKAMFREYLAEFRAGKRP